MNEQPEEMKALDRIVIKSNELIQQSRFSLSLQQQKVVLYLISKITPYDEEFQLYEFSITEFCKICGIDTDNGKNYQNLKDAIKAIADKSLWVKISEDEETILRWIDKPYINKRDGYIKIRLDNDMKPFLLQLKENFTSYELIWTLHFKSKYTIRLYELIKSIHFHELEEYSREFGIDELRRLMGAENYNTWQRLKDRAIIPAVKEINEYSDKNIVMTPLKKGRAVERVKFTITSKDSLAAAEIRDRIVKEMGYEQLTLWDELETRGIV